ncbi:MAG: acetyl-CoA carboxyl transferase, partial [Actinomycetia bacterium]|nr:acetyl-CoA carboxyl transferase [Actinomycetes bacterium]
ELAPAPGTVLVLTRFGGTSCVLVGHDRLDPRPPDPSSLRLVRRAARLAAELDLPLVTIIDTDGAELSATAEEQGTAHGIAQCLAVLADLPVPRVSVLLGLGTGGAALALLPADRVIAARHAWIAPLPPEGASAVLHGTTDRAAELAAAQRIRASDLTGLVDVLVDDGDAGLPAEMAREIGRQLRIAATPADARRPARWRRPTR